MTEADISYDEPGEPKTGARSVPIPQVLVTMLRDWLADNALSAPSDVIFRTRNGTRPTASNWGRAWHRALRSIGSEPLRVYDCRHAAATTWLRAGVPLGEVARRLGHSVDTLISTYVGALGGDKQIANDRIDLGAGCGWIAATPTVMPAAPTFPARDGTIRLDCRKDSYSIGSGVRIPGDARKSTC